MSDPEALREYAAEHEGDTDSVVEKLRKHNIDENEILRVLPMMNYEMGSHIEGDGFTIFRDYQNHFDVKFNDSDKRAA